MSDRIPYIPNRTPTGWNQRVTALMNVGLTFADAAEWANEDLATTPTEIAEIAREFLDHGFTAAQARPWRTALYDAESAERWARHGWWTPSLVDRFVSVVLSHRPHPDIVAGEPCDWAATGLPPERAFLYGRAGCTPGEAVDLEARRAAGEDLDDALWLLIALRA